MAHGLTTLLGNTEVCLGSLPSSGWGSTSNIYFQALAVRKMTCQYTCKNMGSCCYPGYVPHNTLICQVSVS